MNERLTLWPTDTGSWHFLQLPKDIGAEIKEQFGANSRGYGTLPVTVTIGETTWQTSIFAVKAMESYILPVKAAVRKAEDIYEGEKIEFLVQVVVGK